MNTKHNPARRSLTSFFFIPRQHRPRCPRLERAGVVSGNSVWLTQRVGGIAVDAVVSSQKGALGNSLNAQVVEIFSGADPVS